MSETTTIEIPVEQFDLSLLPESSRQPGTEAFRDAVTSFFQGELQPAAEWIQVGVDDRSIKVAWRARGGGTDPVDLAISRFKSGNYSHGIQILQMVLRARPNDPAVCYNLGMALSDLGRLDEAIDHLQVAAEQRHGEANILVALGVAHYRNRQLRWFIEACPTASMGFQVALL